MVGDVLCTVPRSRLDSELYLGRVTTRSLLETCNKDPNEYIHRKISGIEVNLSRVFERNVNRRCIHICRLVIEKENLETVALTGHVDHLEDREVVERGDSKSSSP